MNEILQKLLETDLLTEDSKKELTEAFESHIADVVEEAKTAAIADTKIELHEQFTQQKEQLIEAIDSKVNEFMIAEIEALKEDIKAFRDLEAEKLVEIAKEKKKLGKTLKEDMAKLVKKIDTFLEMRLAEEFKEIKADLKEAKKADFGRTVFEAFLPEFRKYFVDPTSTERELTEMKVKVSDLTKKFKNVKKEKDSLYRKIKVESVLSPLTGASRDVMESILSSVATEKLEEAYKLYLPRVLKESVIPESEKSGDQPSIIKESMVHHSDLPFAKSNFKSGDEFVVESTIPTQEQVVHPSMIQEMTKLAGIA
jgi:hypothetical protein